MLSTAIPTLIAATVIVIISSGMANNPIVPRTTVAAKRLGIMPMIDKYNKMKEKMDQANIDEKMLIENEALILSKVIYLIEFTS